MEINAKTGEGVKKALDWLRERQNIAGLVSSNISTEKQ